MVLGGAKVNEEMSWIRNKTLAPTIHDAPAVLERGKVFNKPADLIQPYKDRFRTRASKPVTGSSQTFRTGELE